MRVWSWCVAVAVTGVCLIAPAQADSGLLFGPPPIGNVDDAQTVLRQLEAVGSSVAAMDVEAPRRRSCKRVRQAQFAPSEARAEVPKDPQTGDQRLPSPPSRLPSGSAGESGESAATRLRGGIPDPAAIGPMEPAPLPDDLGHSAADEPVDSVIDQEVPAPVSGRPADPAAADEPPGYLPHDPAYTAIDESAGTGPESAECPCARSGGGFRRGCSGRSSGGRGGVLCRRGRPASLFDFPLLRSCDIEVAGWLEQGITGNGAVAPNRFNGPVTFNDRSGEYQMNQLYLFAERLTKTCGCGVDVGGRVDLLYGTDRRFTLSDGLDDDWSEGERFYGLSMPQLYLDVACDDLTLRMGHFYSIVGYETVAAPDNFFYSHSYAMQYGEPFTHTGLLGILNVNDCWSITAGVHRGWNRWEDNNHQLGFLGSANWTSVDRRTAAAFAVTTSNEDPAGDNNRFLYSLVLARRIGCRLRYVLQHDLGYEDNGGPNGQDAEWYGINNHLYYDIDPCWSLGVRYEWFNDDDDGRVSAENAAGGPPRGIELEGVAGHWHELTLGLNWKPNQNLLFRTECRWDWISPHDSAAQRGPFNNSGDRHQFLWGTDLIVKF